MNKKNVFAALSGLAMLATSISACAPLSSPTVRESKYQKEVVTPHYGDWYVDPKSCTINAATQELTVSTTGNLTKSSLMPLTVTYAMPLIGKPTPSLSGIPVPIPQDGTGQRYTIYLEYSPRSVASLWYDGTFLTLTYTPLNATKPHEAYLQTRGLIDAIAHLSTHCS